MLRLPVIPKGVSDLVTLNERTYAALVHHPVVDKHGKTVTTAVTNLDIHDIARSSRTFGLAGYHMITPVSAQQELVGRIIGHWKGPVGMAWNDKRTEALRLVQIQPSIDASIAAITERHGERPLVVVTAAKNADGVKTAAEIRENVETSSVSRPLMLVFGTGWGLHQSVLDQADARLNPIQGPCPYNHLSVRSAVAIILDRFFGNR